MLKKNEVYVTVDSPKVAKKLKKVLDMFGEKVFSSDGIDDALRKGWVMEFYMGDWCNNSYNSHDKTKVTVSEIKQILFREHAKKGDVVVCGIDRHRWVVKFDGFLNDGILGYYVHNGDKVSEETGCFDKFIRYATEEEKALLNPVKELETGKWYSGNGEKLIFVSELSECGELARGYGIGANGNWYDDDGSYSWLTCDLKEATKEEVETALRKEAEKRGFVKGSVFQGVAGAEKDMRIPIEEIIFDVYKGGGLYSRNSWVFLDGKWADVIEQEKTLEQRVKELEDFIYGKKEFIANIKGEDLQLVLERKK